LLRVAVEVQAATPALMVVEVVVPEEFCNRL
jgi:hypothetical protein